MAARKMPARREASLPAEVLRVQDRTQKEFDRAAEAVAAALAPHRLRSQQEDTFWRDLEAQFGIDREALFRLMPDPMDPREGLVSPSALRNADEMLRAVEHLERRWPVDDERALADLARLRKKAVRRRSEIQAAVKTGGFEPGRRGRDLRMPDTDGHSWKWITDHYPAWRNPVTSTWLGDRIYAVAQYIADHVDAERIARRGGVGKRGRLLARNVCALTADIINRRYRMTIFRDICVTPKHAKDRIATRKRKSASPA